MALKPSTPYAGRWSLATVTAGAIAPVVDQVRFSPIDTAQLYGNDRASIAKLTRALHAGPCACCAPHEASGQDTDQHGPDRAFSGFVRTASSSRTPKLETPGDYARKLLDSGTRRDVVVEAFSPLGTGYYLSNRIVRRVAAHVGRTPAQVLLRWGLQRNVVVLPKSTHRERIEENARIFDFTLGDEEMAALDALNRTDRAA